MLGRLVDRHGQAKVLLPALVLYAAGLGGLVALALSGAPSWTLFPAAAVFGGSYPQPGSLVRARWAHALSGTPLLPTAFSLESVLDEVVFVVGPVLVGPVLATAVSRPPACCPRRCSRSSARWRWPRSGAPSRRHTRTATGCGEPSVLRLAGVRVLVLVGAAVGGIFGAVEVATVAFTDERGRPAAAGIVLALLRGRQPARRPLVRHVRWRAPLPTRFVRGVVLLAVVTVPLPLAPNVHRLPRRGLGRSSPPP